MQTIIAAVDFSEASQNAVSYAAYLTNAFNARLVVVHAYISNEAIENEPLLDLFEMSDNLNDANLKFLDVQMQGLIRKYTVRIKGIVKKGKPVSVIKKLAREENASLIIMGMKGRGKSNSMFGSTTVQMIGKTDIPILVVPENAVYKPIENLLVAVDFKSRISINRYKVLNKLIERYKPFIRILNVQKKNEPMTSEMISGKTRTGKIWGRYDHQFHIIESEDVEKGINNFLRRYPVDLMAMTAGRHNLLDRLFSKSYTRSMTRQTRTPLLIMHPAPRNA